MDYIISNITSRGEIRISNKEIEGRIIYRGHKLGLPDELLPHILRYNHEKSKGKYYFLDYKKWNDIYNLEKLNVQMTQCWFMEADNKKALLKSYSTLLEAIKCNTGNFRNIYIVEI